MKTARQLLAVKGNAILSVAPSSNVHDALISMEKHHVGALLVIDTGRLVGIFSERLIKKTCSSLHKKRTAPFHSSACSVFWS
jgi:CBS domain-containing protein